MHAAVLLFLTLATVAFAENPRLNVTIVSEGLTFANANVSSDIHGTDDLNWVAFIKQWGEHGFDRYEGQFTFENETWMNKLTENKCETIRNYWYDSKGMHSGLENFACWPASSEQFSPIGWLVNVSGVRGLSTKSWGAGQFAETLRKILGSDDICFPGLQDGCNGGDKTIEDCASIQAVKCQPQCMLGKDACDACSSGQFDESCKKYGHLNGSTIYR